MTLPGRSLEQLPHGLAGGLAGHPAAHPSGYLASRVHRLPREIGLGKEAMLTARSPSDIIAT